MLQIKTIKEQQTYVFDSLVNEALRDGWSLTGRHITPDGFVAELTKVVITEAERCCENCLHYEKNVSEPPCCACEDASHWEAEA